MRFHFRSHSGRNLASFTLIELLVVIVIIAILAGLTLAAGEGALTQAARSRARAEIQAMSAALENFKSDNGGYPWTNSQQTAFTSTNDYTQNPSLAGGSYQVSGQVLYETLSGLTNYNDTPVPGTKSYMNFKTSQLGNVKGAGGYNSSTSTYVQDPFGYSYGYYASTDTTAPPYNGTGQFDLWSTGNTTPTTANWPNYATWISNWTQ